jgi:hypothetical protein
VLSQCDLQGWRQCSIDGVLIDGVLIDGVLIDGILIDGVVNGGATLTCRVQSDAIATLHGLI